MESTERRTENSATIITPWNSEVAFDHAKVRWAGNAPPESDAEFRARYEHVCALALDYYTADAKWWEVHERKMRAQRTADREAEVRAETELNMMFPALYDKQRAYEKACREFFMNNAERTP